MDCPSQLPARRELFVDERGEGRALRVTWHPEGGVVVFSQWRGRTCAGTFRMPVGDAPALVEILRGSLEEAYGGARSSLLRDFGAVDDQDVG